MPGVRWDGAHVVSVSVHEQACSTCYRLCWAEGLRGGVCQDCRSRHVVSPPAHGLLAALKDAAFLNVSDQVDAARVVSRWLADHLDALAETGHVDQGSFRLAAAEVRAVGGVQ